MKEIRTEIEIAAPAERVWEILSDFSHYPAWNPLVPEAAGELRVGARLKLRVVAGREMHVTPEVLRHEPPRTLRWRGVMGHRVIFSGEHWFTIEPLSAQRVKFSQGEIYTGLLIPMFASTLEREARPAFEQMNRAIKERAEQAATRT